MNANAKLIQMAIIAIVILCFLAFLNERYHHQKLHDTLVEMREGNTHVLPPPHRPLPSPTAYMPEVTTVQVRFNNGVAAELSFRSDGMTEHERTRAIHAIKEAVADINIVPEEIEQ